MTTASRSLATALWGARFASGLLRPELHHPVGHDLRVLFTAQDSLTIRNAFGRAKPNAEYTSPYAAAVARRQTNQIYNLSLTRTATVIFGQGARGVIGVADEFYWHGTSDHRVKRKRSPLSGGWTKSTISQ